MSKQFTVVFPDIGEGVVEGEVIEWRKNVGDSIAQDEPVVVVMTDKATVELPSPHPGKLAKQYYQPGEIAIKDTPLYDIELGFEVEAEKRESPQASSSHQEQPEKVEKTLISPKTVPNSSSTVKSSQSKDHLALPKVRALAKQLGIPLDQVDGSGKDGRITPEDLGRYKIQPSKQMHPSQGAVPLPGDKELPLIGIKALMAKKMAQSNSHIPHFSYFEQADVTRLVQLKSNLKEKAECQNVHLTYMPFLLRAISICIAKHPLLNSSFDEEHSKVIVHQKQNIGIAMATSLGLIVPVLKNLEEMKIESIIFAYEELMQRAHAGKLLPSDMKDSTFTLSNFGSANTHGLWATPVISQPEVGILAISRIQPQPMAKNGEVVVREVLHLSWSFDHRIIDGETASQISKTFCHLIENPASLL